MHSGRIYQTWTMCSALSIRDHSLVRSGYALLSVRMHIPLLKRILNLMSYCHAVSWSYSVMNPSIADSEVFKDGIMKNTNFYSQDLVIIAFLRNQS